MSARPEGAISVNAYAKLRGCTEGSVRKAVKSGKIVAGHGRDANNQPYIIPSVADKEWSKNFNPNYDRNHKLQEQMAGEPSEAADSGGGSQTLSKAKTLKAVYDAKNAELDYNERIGKLVKKDDVYKALFAYGQQIRDAFEGLPGRVVDDVLASNGRVDAFNIIQAEVKNILTKLSEMDNLPLK